MPLATVVMMDCDNYNGTAFSVAWNPVEDTREVLKGRLKGYRVSNTLALTETSKNSTVYESRKLAGIICKAVFSAIFA